MCDHDLIEYYQLLQEESEKIDKKISKSYKFDSYMDGIEFVMQMAKLAETNNHHPDISIGWCQVDVSITSHDLGGVSTKCVNLALGIDLISE